MANVTNALMRELLCATCGKDAACIGRYEDMTSDDPACNECCGHGCEDGHCTYLTDDDGEYTDEAKARVGRWLAERVVPEAHGPREETPW